MSFFLTSFQERSQLSEVLDLMDIAEQYGYEAYLIPALEREQAFELIETLQHRIGKGFQVPKPLMNQLLSLEESFTSEEDEETDVLEAEVKRSMLISSAKAMSLQMEWLERGKLHEMLSETEFLLLSRFLQRFSRLIGQTEHYYFYEVHQGRDVGCI